MQHFFFYLYCELMVQELDILNILRFYPCLLMISQLSILFYPIQTMHKENALLGSQGHTNQEVLTFIKIESLSLLPQLRPLLEFPLCPDLQSTTHALTLNYCVKDYFFELILEFTSFSVQILPQPDKQVRI